MRLNWVSINHYSNLKATVLMRMWRISKASQERICNQLVSHEEVGISYILITKSYAEVSRYNFIFQLFTHLSIVFKPDFLVCDISTFMFVCVCVCVCVHHMHD